MSETAHDYPYQLVTRRIGLWLFIASEAVVFLALLYIRFIIGAERPEELNQPLGLAITILLLISSFTANRAEVLISKGDQKGFLRNLGITLVLGLAFLFIVVFIEWPEVKTFAPVSTGYGTLFFVITGMHAFHVFTGLFALTIAYFQGRKGKFTADDYWGAQGTIVYWHFVDIVWVFVYPILYLFGS